MASSNASQYLSKLFDALVSGKITDLKDGQLKRIASIITGLVILNNPKFHSIIRLQPGELDQIKSTLSTKSTADHVATIGTRSPSMLAKNEQILVHWGTRSKETKTALAKQIKQLIVSFNSVAAQPATKPTPQETSPSSSTLPSPQTNLSKPPV